VEMSALGPGGARRRYNGGERSCVSGMDDTMSRITVDDLRPEDAADADDIGRETAFLRAPPPIDISQTTICCGPQSLCSRPVRAYAIDNLLDIAYHDGESRRIVKLGVPLTFSSIAGAIFSTITVALVAQYLGTNDLTAYVVNDLLVGLSDTFITGVQQSLNTVCSHAVGMDDFKLAGQYVQISSVLYILFATPFLGMWCFVIDDVVLWMGLGEEVAAISLRYTRVVVFHYAMEGFSEGIFTLLDITGHEVFGTIIDLIEGVSELAIVWWQLASRDNLELADLGWIHLLSAAFWYLVTIVIVFYKGWLSRFTGGMLRTNALKNYKAVKNIFSMAIPLSIGSLLEYGEWELLTIFIASLGPAEVATWGILGSMWELFEAATSGLGEAAAIRVAFHLGKGEYDLARISAYKSLFLSVILSVFITSVFFMLGDSLANMLTRDALLRNMLNEAIPMIGVGNILMVFGMVSWSLVGAQGRYRLATTVSIISSWTVTLPLCALFIYGYRFNIEGVAAAVVVGYSTSGSIFAVLLITSDWKHISDTIRRYNQDGSDSSDSSDSDSDDSSSDDSSSSSESDSDMLLLNAPDQFRSS